MVGIRRKIWKEGKAEERGRRATTGTKEDMGGGDRGSMRTWGYVWGK
jgi:hypothetical protein